MKERQKIRKRMKITKGNYGYLKSQKRKTIIKTIGLFSISGAIFLTGYLTAHTKANLLTVIAVLGMLPASKSAVEMILFLRQKECSYEGIQKIIPHMNRIPCAYELVLTSYEKNFPITAIAVMENSIYGYSEDDKCDIPAAEKHILEILKQNGLKPTIKIFKELEPFINRLDALQGTENQTVEKEIAILDVIKAIAI